MKQLNLKFLLALLLPFTLIMGGGIWGSSAQHTHRSASQGGLIPWIPTAFIGCYAGTTPPTNTLESYGQAVSRVTYPDLFAQIGTTYGVGDGSTTFNLPDIRGRVMVGMDNMGGSSANRVTDAQADALGGTGGTEIISIAQMPSHTHDELGNGGAQIWRTGSGSAGLMKSNATGTWLTGSVREATEATGGGAAFNPPFIALKCVIGT